MPVQTINPGDIRGSFFGGVPYSASWSFNGGESPSTLNIDVINEIGTYTISNGSLSFVNKVSVGIGSFSFTGYLVSYEIETTATQKILHLEYIDSSADLDRYYVGLKGRHAAATNVILVGKPYNPCDTSRSSKTVSIGGSNVDPCDPCPYMPANKYTDSCSDKINKLKIWPVYYTFDELISAIPLSKGAVNNPNPYFKANHTGTLRSVLSAWCSDLGLSIYWDPINNILNFISRSSPLTIKVAPPANAVEIRSGATKQSTFARGFMGYFSKDGEIKSYDCSTNDDSSNITRLKCITLGDLYQETELNDDKGIAGLGMTKLQARYVAASMAKYGKSARDYWAWFNHYKITSRDRAARMRNVNMFHMGGLKILESYSISSDSYRFGLCRDVVNLTDLNTIKNQDAKNGMKPDSPSYYFIIASVDDAYAESQFQASKDLADNFIGKYFYAFKNVPIAGASNDSRSQVSVEAPDGNAEWYYAGQELRSLPLFGFGHTNGSTIGKLFNTFDSSYVNNVASESNKARLAASIILLERSPKWLPSPDQIQYYQTLFSYYEDFIPKKVGNDGRPDILYSLYPGAQDDTSIKLFLCRSLYNETSVTLSTLATNSLEPSKAKQKIVYDHDIEGNQVKRIIGNYGLVTNNCTSIKIDDFIIQTPACGYNNEGFGYDVFVKATASFTKVIPKIEYTESVNAGSLDVAKLDYQFKEISEDNLSLLRIGQSKSCVPSTSSISSYIKDVGGQSSYSMSSAINKCSFKVPGAAPLSYGIDAGLSSVQISVGENGIFTSYSFEDKITQPPGEEYLMQQLRDRTENKNTLAGHGITSENVRMIGSSKI